MINPGRDDAGRERIIAGLLRYGVRLACAIITVGMTIELLLRPTGLTIPGVSGYDLVKAGVALFILLPVARVALMIVLFLRQRDYAFAAISTVVLAIIGAGLLVGL